MSQDQEFNRVRICARIDQAVTDSGLTNKEIAQRMNERNHPISHESVRKYRKGEQLPPDPEVLRVLADILGKPIRWILFAEEDRYMMGPGKVRVELANDEYNLLMLFRTMPRDGQNQILKYCDFIADSFPQAKVTHLRKPKH